MPLIAVAVAAVSVAGVGAAGFAAVLAGTASIGTMFAAVAAVGATVNAIGAVTGNKDLQTAGMVMGGIGGVGSLATAVGAFGEGATMGSVFGSEGAANAASGVDAATGVGEAAGGGDFVGTAASEAGETSSWTGAGSGWTDTAGVGDYLMDSQNMGVIDTANDIAGAGTKSLIPDIGDGATALNKAPSDGLVASENFSSGTDVVKPTTAADAAAADKSTAIADDLAKGSSVDPKVTGKVDDGGGLFGKDGFFSTRGGGMIGMGVVQAAGSFLSGATDSLKPAQVEAYQAQAHANDAAAAMSNQQLANMQGKIPVARRVAVTGKPGLINNPQGAAA